jgi:hypothetical protein
MYYNNRIVAECYMEENRKQSKLFQSHVSKDMK